MFEGPKSLSQSFLSSPLLIRPFRGQNLWAQHWSAASGRARQKMGVSRSHPWEPTGKRRFFQVPTQYSFDTATNFWWTGPVRCPVSLVFPRFPSLVGPCAIGDSRSNCRSRPRRSSFAGTRLSGLRAVGTVITHRALIEAALSESCWPPVVVWSGGEETWPRGGFHGAFGALAYWICFAQLGLQLS